MCRATVRGPPRQVFISTNNDFGANTLRAMARARRGASRASSARVRARETFISRVRRARDHRGRVDAMLSPRRSRDSVLLGVSSPSSSEAEGQPIDWLLKTTFDEDVDLVEIIKASASGDDDAGSAAWLDERATASAEAEAKKRAEAAGRGDGGTTEEPEEEREPVDVAATATKFGKLGAILVFADVVTAAIMGKSVLGVAKSMERELEMGEDGARREVKKTAEPAEGGDWKERMADKLMNKLKEKNAEEVEGEDGDSSA